VLLTSAMVYGCRVVTTDIYLATALFELLHDTQYLTIVWAFNQSRQRSGTALRPFRGRLFAPGPRGALLYVGLCLAYGALAFGPRVLEAHSLVKQVVEAWLVTSGLLHFYFDGFIWKVREADIGATLSLDPAALPQTVRAAWGSPGVRAVAHAACWVAIAGALFGLEQRAVAGDALTRTQRMVELVPDNTTAQGELGFLLLNQGRFADARPHLARALELMPDQPNVESNLGVVELNLGHPETALGMLDRARRHAAGRARIDGLERNRGDVLMVLNQPGEAKASFLLALDETPGDPDVLLRLALSQARLGAPAEALRSLDQALARNPALVEAHFVRGEVLNQLGRVDDGRAALERALQLDPGFAPARHLLARLPPP
jgi:Flp pilus assembly protein TadD